MASGSTLSFGVPADALTVSLRLATLPLVVLLALLAWRDHRRAAGVQATAALLLGIACHLGLPLALAGNAPGLLVEGLALGALFVPLAFWVASRGLFEDDFRLRPVPLLLLGALLALRYAAWLGRAGEAPADSALWPDARPLELGSSLLAAGVVLDALRRIHAGARIDLVGTRLRQRRLVLGVSGLYMLFVLAGEVLVRGTEYEPDAAFADALLVLLLVFAVSWRLLRVDTGLLAPRRPPTEPHPELERLVPIR